MTTRQEAIERLRRQQIELARQAEELGRWRALALSEHGKFLLESARTRLAFVQGLYAAVDARQEGATVAVAEIQGMEREANAIVQRLTDIEKVQKALDEEAKKVSTGISRIGKVSKAEGSDGILSDAVPHGGGSQ